MAASGVWDATSSGLRAVVGHPLRTHLLGWLASRVASPSELAVAVDEPLPNVAYHVKVLEEEGAIELVRTVPGGRNSTEHFYRANEHSLVDDEATLRMTAEERMAYSRPVAQLATADLAQSMSSYALVALYNHHLSRTVLELDKQGWDEAVRLLTATLTETLAIKARSAERLGGATLRADGQLRVASTAGAIQARVNLQLFEMPRLAIPAL